MFASFRWRTVDIRSLAGFGVEDVAYRDLGVHVAPSFVRHRLRP